MAEQTLTILDALQRLSTSHPRFQHVNINEIRWSNGEGVINCPFHDDNSPSMSINATKNVFHCWGCGVGGNQWDLIGMALFSDYESSEQSWQSHKAAIAKWLRDGSTTGGPLPVVKSKPRKKFNQAIEGPHMEHWRKLLMNYNHNLDHLATNFGIRKDTAEHFGLGFTAFEVTGGMFFAIPYVRSDGHLYGIRLRNIVRKPAEGEMRYRWITGSNGQTLYNGAILLKKEVGSRLYIVEDEWSVMALWQYGRDAVARFAILNQEGGIHPEWLQHLNQFKCTIIPDLDLPGLKCAKTRRAVLNGKGHVPDTAIALLPMELRPKGVKDFADLARLFPDRVESWLQEMESRS